MFLCKHCNSSMVHYRAYIKPIEPVFNKEPVTPDFPNYYSYLYCPDCGWSDLPLVFISAYNEEEAWRIARKCQLPSKKSYLYIPLREPADRRWFVLRGRRAHSELFLIGHFSIDERRFLLGKLFVDNN